MSVLVVEDNPDVQKSLTRILKQAGYDVDVAENGLVALALIQERSYEAIVSDIMMPVMDGARLYEVLRHQHPEAAKRVVFASAWFDDGDVRDFLARTSRPVLRKPFDIDEFLDIVRQIAAQPTDPSPSANPG